MHDSLNVSQCDIYIQLNVRCSEHGSSSSPTTAKSKTNRKGALVKACGARQSTTDSGSQSAVNFFGVAKLGTEELIVIEAYSAFLTKHSSVYQKQT